MRGDGFAIESHGSGQHFMQKNGADKVIIV